MLKSGDRLEVEIEKPAAGGRMIARHEGQIVLVSGAIPGEKVRCGTNAWTSASRSLRQRRW